MSDDPSDTVVLVSGGSRGLGLALVKGLRRRGYRVATFSRRATPAIEKLIQADPDGLFFTEGDMADGESLEAVVQRVEDQLGPIAGLVNNAGIARDGVLALMTPAEIETVIGVNLTGSLLLTRQVVRKMLVRSAGSIINITSIIGLRGYSGLAAYAATKAGLDAATRALARELGPRQIRVNSIAPGYLKTEMTDTLSQGQKDQIIRRTPLARLGTPADVVGAAIFLLSDDARFITGQTLVVDGGITC